MIKLLTTQTRQFRHATGALGFVLASNSFDVTLARTNHFVHRSGSNHMRGFLCRRLTSRERVKPFLGGCFGQLLLPPDTSSWEGVGSVVATTSH